MVIVDTTVWIDFFGGIVNDHTSWLRREADSGLLALTDLIFCEILQGIRDDRTVTRVQQHLLSFDIYETGGAAMALVAARNYRTLRRRGYTVRTTIDCLIATFCIESGHALLHRDQDFDPFEEFLHLQVIHP